ncbi:MAG TPA: hypothetical protein VMA98_09890 [Candidatus Acidoferrales bacterium]|nr:hypothetical protein [Candidatus Acidoferrales bacterium]
MSERARWINLVCGAIAAFVLVACVLATIRVNWVASVCMAFAVGAFYSDRIYIGFVPLPMPSFEDRVKGNMLGGMSEERAREQASAGEIVKAFGNVVISTIVCIVATCFAYGAYPHVGARALYAFIGKAGLWLAAGMFVLFAVAVFAPLYARLAKRKA